MNIPKHMRFLIALAVQVAIIFAIIIYKSAILAGGAPVLLRLEPVDPRDLFRGDYMTIRYEISAVPKPYLNIANGETIFVPLRADGKFMAADSYRITTVEPSDGLFIRGRVISGGSQTGTDWDGGILRVAYGIEDYFFPEGLGSQANFWGQGAEPYAKVLISDSGSPVLQQLYVNDMPWPESGRLESAPMNAVPAAVSKPDPEQASSSELSIPGQ